MKTLKIKKTEYEITFYGYESFFKDLPCKGIIEVGHIFKLDDNSLFMSYRHGYFPQHPYGIKMKKYFEKNKEKLQKELIYKKD